jgi:uncharacterized membrane protein YcaP (DUF421 family)
METVLRVAILYVFLVVGLRVLGKREFSQLSSTDLVMLLIVSELVQQALVGEDFSATNAVIAVSTLFLLTFLNSTLEHHSKRFSGLVTGQPAVIVYDGRFVPRTMNLERIAPDDVYSEMRKAGLAELSEVRWALLEPDGRLSFVPFRQEAKQIKREAEAQSG